MSDKGTRLTQIRVGELLEYDPETGLFTWRFRSSSGGTQAGDLAGVLDRSTGYVRICVDYHRVYAHRLAFLYMTGAWPPDRVDHINQDRADNRWANLRPATHAQNFANRGLNRNNKSGFKGVHACGNCAGRWYAQIVINGEHKYLGIFKSPEAAAAAYRQAAIDHYGEFARAA